MIPHVGDFGRSLQLVIGCILILFAIVRVLPEILTSDWSDPPTTLAGCAVFAMVVSAGGWLIRRGRRSRRAILGYFLIVSAIWGVLPVALVLSSDRREPLITIAAPTLLAIIVFAGGWLIRSSKRQAK
jgi:hypothetical protein